MADYIPVPDDVRQGSGITPIQGTAGEALERGDAIFIHSFDTKGYLTDSDDSEEMAQFDGIVLTKAAANQPFLYQPPSGKIHLGVDIPVGQVVVVSENPGRLAPAEDGASGWWTTVAGVGDEDGNLDMTISGDSGYMKTA